MTIARMWIESVDRCLSDGRSEELRFETGVNLLVGAPGTGKTKWLQTLDYLLGDTGGDPFESTDDDELARKYSSAGATLVINGQRLRVERKWREVGAKSKVFVDGEPKTTQDFQHLLMTRLGIPILHYPKGNPTSGQTWPELSFRSLLRHVYRQQRFWGDIADQQPEGEQYACMLQLLGIADRMFTDEYGHLVKLKAEAERLKARRDQYGQTLDEIVGEVVSGDIGNASTANTTTVSIAEERVAEEIELLQQRRAEMIANARDTALREEELALVEELGRKRVQALERLETVERQSQDAAGRLQEIQRYRGDLQNEFDKLIRSEEAAVVLSDLKVTNCPACDQPLLDAYEDSDNCFLCRRPLQQVSLGQDLGPLRLAFERDRLGAEVKEAEDLVEVLTRQLEMLKTEQREAQEEIRHLDGRLEPARTTVAPLVQESVSEVDMRLGQLREQQLQLARVSGALAVGQAMTDKVAELEKQIVPLSDAVNESIRSIDFSAAADVLEEGMNAYLMGLNQGGQTVWRHSPVTLDLGKRAPFTFRIGGRRWGSALGGTDTLYFLMAYQYGLLSLSSRPSCNYPGLSIIDVPGEFSGEKIGDKENFIVQPFLDLLSKPEYSECQLVVTGASFEGLVGAHRLQQTKVYAAR